MVGLLLWSLLTLRAAFREPEIKTLIVAAWPKVRQALGFVTSGPWYRFADAGELAWRPADAVLGSRTLSNLFVGGLVIVVLVAIVRHDGRFGLVADIQDPVTLGAFLYCVIRAGRRWRGIKPPPPKSRRAEERGPGVNNGGPPAEG